MTPASHGGEPLGPPGPLGLRNALSCSPPDLDDPPRLGGFGADRIRGILPREAASVAPALSMGATGVITMSGAPESHLRILSREFQMPCVMTAYLTNSELRYVTGGQNDAHFAAIIEALNGKRVRLHCEDREFGRVALVD